MDDLFVEGMAYITEAIETIEDEHRRYSASYALSSLTISTTILKTKVTRLETILDIHDIHFER